MDKISVIVPVYNTEKYLEKCLDSLVNQTYKNLEIIVVNDSSPDESQKIIDKFVKNNSNVIAFLKPNGGVSEARNFGIKKATGKYIGFVDSDDWIELNMYEKLYEKMISGDYDFITSDLIYRYDNPKRDFILRDGLKKDLSGNELKKYMVDMYPVIWNKLYKKELFSNEFKFKKNVWFEDVELLLKIMTRVNNVGYVNESLYNYLQREGSITSTFDKRLYDCIYNLNDIIKWYKKEGIYKKYKKEIEYFYVRYVYATFVKRTSNLNKEDFNKAFDFAIKNVKENFPRYRYNKYLYREIKGIYLFFACKSVFKIYYSLMNFKRRNK